MITRQIDMQTDKDAGERGHIYEETKEEITM
jgi:hypothetical protein